MDTTSDPAPVGDDRRMNAGARRRAPIISALLGAVSPNGWALPVLVVLGVVTSLTEGIGIGMMIPLFDVLFQGEGAASGWFVSALQMYGAGLEREERLALLVATICVLIVVKAAVQYAYDALAIWFSGKVVNRLRHALFQQLLSVGYAFFAGFDQGRLFDILKGETWLAGEFLMTVSRMVISICTVAALGFLLMMISWQLTLLAAVGVGLISLLVRLVAKRARRLGRETVEASAALSRLAIEALSGMRVIRLFGQEAREQQQFDLAVGRSRRASLKVELAAAVIPPMTELLYAPLFLGILLLAWYSGISLPTLAAFLVLLYRLQPHVRRLDHLRVELAGLVPAVTQITWLLDPSDKPYIRSGSHPFRGLQQGIRFEDVSFSYRRSGDDRPAVAGLTFEIRKNEVTAIVGESGAGKSTLISLLCRFYDPTGGEIRVDGVPLRELDLASWRRRLAFAGQDGELAGDTIRSAIAYGRPGADHEEIVAAARQAHAYDFVMDLPDGFDTRIDVRGLQLSAGQRQRIGLARAFLRRPDVLILDEATNALDSLSENAIQEALEQLAGRITIVMIAHRLSTIRHADRVVVLSGGRVVEQGDPRSLLQRESTFAKLWQAQANAFDDDKTRPAEAADRDAKV